MTKIMGTFRYYANVPKNNIWHIKTPPVVGGCNKNTKLQVQLVHRWQREDKTMSSLCKTWEQEEWTVKHAVEGSGCNHLLENDNDENDAIMLVESQRPCRQLRHNKRQFLAVTLWNCTNRSIRVTSNNTVLPTFQTLKAATPSTTARCEWAIKKQDRQCTCNVTLRRVRVIIVAVEEH